jgi:hypothetical protein
MRQRSARVLPIAVIAAAGLALPATAQAASPAPVTPTTVMASRRASTVTLPTGDHVRVVTTSGQVHVEVQPAATSGPGRVLTTRRLGSQISVVPAVAEPYLGRFLDRSLFDVTRIRAGLKSDGRLPIRISYQGATPSLPGVHITSAASGVATGYLTPSSSAAFGRALTAQWKADSKAGWPARTTLFDGVTKIVTDLPGSAGATPKFPMYTLIVKAVGPDGKPLAEGEAGVMNVDNGQKYIGFVGFENGEARISVPAGNYDVIADTFEYDDATGKAAVRIATAGNYRVTGAGQTVSVDLRRATVTPMVSVPKKATLLSGLFTWDRYDASGDTSFSNGYFFDPDTTLYVAPSKPSAVGTQDSTVGWNLVGPGTNPAYTYDVATFADQIPATMKYTFTAADLATVQASYYGDGATRTGGFGRTALFPGQDFYITSINDVTRPSRRTEYVGAVGASARWAESALTNVDSFDDPGFIDGQPHAIKAGTTPTLDWFRGPLGSLIPTQTFFPYCYACRTSKQLNVVLAPFVDSVPTHVGNLFGALDGLPVGRFRLYQDDTLLFDKDDYPGAFVSVPASKATYRAIMDVDRRLQEPLQSTRSHTELTFSSAAGGPTMPSDWFCDLDATCTVLPIVQARLALPTSLNGTLPAKKSTVTVSVGQIQGAKTSTVTSGGLEIRPSGSDWITVPLKAAGGGKYTGTIDSTDYAGSDVDVRISGADAAGSTFQQTVLSAYTVASK